MMACLAHTHLNLTLFVYVALNLHLEALGQPFDPTSTITIICYSLLLLGRLLAFAHFLSYFLDQNTPSSLAHVPVHRKKRCYNIIWVFWENEISVYIPRDSFYSVSCEIFHCISYHNSYYTIKIVFGYQLNQMLFWHHSV